MEKNKINEIGKKLDVDPSGIIKEKSKNKKKYKQYYIANSLNFILSSIFGVVFGLFEHKDFTGYPYANFNNIFGLFGTFITNFLNGIYVMSPRFNYILNNKKRFPKVILNAFLSFLSYLIIFGLVAYSNGTPTGIMYNVYDSNKKQ